MPVVQLGTLLDEGRKYLDELKHVLTSEDYCFRFDAGDEWVAESLRDWPKDYPELILTKVCRDAHRHRRDVMPPSKRPKTERGLKAFLTTWIKREQRIVLGQHRPPPRQQTLPATSRPPVSYTSRSTAPAPPPEPAYEPTPEERAALREWKKKLKVEES